MKLFSSNVKDDLSAESFDYLLPVGTRNATTYDKKKFDWISLLKVVIETVCMYIVPSVVDPKLFFPDPDPTFQEISDPDPILDPS